jgi:hypothetical protein
VYLELEKEKPVISKQFIMEFLRLGFTGVIFFIVVGIKPSCEYEYSFTCINQQRVVLHETNNDMHNNFENVLRSCIFV